METGVIFCGNWRHAYPRNDSCKVIVSVCKFVCRMTLHLSRGLESGAGNRQIDRKDQVRQGLLLEELYRAAVSWGNILMCVMRRVDVMRDMLLTIHDDIPTRNTTQCTHPLMHLLDTDINKTSLTWIQRKLQKVVFWTVFCETVKWWKASMKQQTHQFRLLVKTMRGQQGDKDAC